MMPYNPPYYNDHLTAYGFKKAKDLYAFIRLTEVPISERIKKIIGRVLKTPDIKMRNIDLKKLPQEMETIREIYNSAWREIWGFVPITSEEMLETAKSLKPILNPQLTCIIEIDSKPAAFSITIPDVNTALKKIKGKLTPFNLMPFLLNLRKIRQGRLILLGTKKEYRNKGLELLMIKQIISDTRELGWTHGELSWVLEDNQKIISVIEEFGGRLYKKYRIYEKQST
jgi:hypothetical protein